MTLLDRAAPPTAALSVATAPPPMAVGTTARYRVALACTADQVRAAQALRFAVFNLELREGLAASYATGRDVDRFDAACDHLIVEDTTSGQVVGTYRLQTGLRAACREGWYGEGEFDFAPFEPMRDRLVELGRACIHASHRSFGVLNLLWGGIAAYARAHGARWLIGCSSITSQDAAVGAATWARLAPHRTPEPWVTVPRPGFACPLDVEAADAPPVPKLLAAYLALGATICAPPAIDRAFRTIDFLTLLDLESPTLRALQRRGRFGGVAPG